MLPPLDARPVRMPKNNPPDLLTVSQGHEEAIVLPRDARKCSTDDVTFYVDPAR